MCIFMEGYLRERDTESQGSQSLETIPRDTDELAKSTGWSSPLDASAGEMDLGSGEGTSSLGLLREQCAL